MRLWRWLIGSLLIFIVTVAALVWYVSINIHPEDPTQKLKSRKLIAFIERGDAITKAQLKDIEIYPAYPGICHKRGIALSNCAAVVLVLANDATKEGQHLLSKSDFPLSELPFLSNEDHIYVIEVVPKVGNTYAPTPHGISSGGFIVVNSYLIDL